MNNENFQVLEMLKTLFKITIKQTISQENSTAFRFGVITNINQEDEMLYIQIPTGFLKKSVSKIKSEVSKTTQLTVSIKIRLGLS